MLQMTGVAGEVEQTRVQTLRLRQGRGGAVPGVGCEGGRGEGGGGRGGGSHLLCDLVDSVLS